MKSNPQLEYYLDRARRGLVTNGLLHCHVPYVHSVVLEDRPEGRVRVFYADARHELFRNEMSESYRPVCPDMTLAFHAHRMDITLVPLFGTVHNSIATFAKGYPGEFNRFAYKSKILDGESKLELLDEYWHVTSMRTQRLDPMDASYMAASEMHTIHVKRHLEAAWLVYEGQPDPGYKATCFTNAKTFDAEGLYKPMTQGEIVNVLAHLKENTFV